MITPQESNPEVFNDFASKLGMGTQLWLFGDVYGLDPDLLAMVPQPVLALIMLFPITPDTEAAKQQGAQHGRHIAIEMHDITMQRRHAWPRRGKPLAPMYTSPSKPLTMRVAQLPSCTLLATICTLCRWVRGISTKLFRSPHLAQRLDRFCADFLKTQRP